MLWTWVRFVLGFLAAVALAVAAGVLVGWVTPAKAAQACHAPPWPPLARPVVRLEPGDVRALAEVIYGEGRSETLCGQIAIGWVVVNRLRQNPKAWGATITQVVTAPNQFSSFGKTDPNLKRMKRADESEHAFYYAQVAAMAVLGGAPDNTMGATHFYHVNMDPPPKWASKLTKVGQIGSHVFYK